MQQLDIQYFFPLTEQIPLDLDYEPSRLYAKELNRQRSMIGADGTVLMASGTGFTTWATSPTTISFMPDNNSVGYWKVGEGLQMHNKKKPSWLHRQMTKIFFGWKWENK